MTLLKKRATCHPDRWNHAGGLCASCYNKSYRLTHPNTWPRRAAAARLLKAEVYKAYGGAKCACCGETLFEGLTMDHIKGDGAIHRRLLGMPKGGYHLYRWLKAHGYPEGFQVLCGTYNIAKRTSDHCPHRDAR
jgi:hypothetical protein